MPSSSVAKKSAKPNKPHSAGGYIKGPGTGTSDNVPAKVVQTNEPLAVSNGERIVSVAQDKFLTKVAKGAGHKSLDAMLEAGTGKPVGPTLKYIEQPGSRIKASAKAPIKHADLGGMIGGVKRALGLAPPQTMREKFAEQDAKRAPVATAPVPAASVPTTPPGGVQGGLDGSGGNSLGKRMAAAGAARGAKIKSGMAAKATKPPKMAKEKKDPNAVKQTEQSGDAEEARGDASGQGILASAKNQTAAMPLIPPPVQALANGGMFSGGDPYAIPGYTPGMVQRSGKGLPGYNPLTQGQTVSVPTGGGEEATPEQIKKMETKGFAGGGIVGQTANSPFRQTNSADDTTRRGYASGGKIVRAAAGGMSPESLDAQKQVMATLDPNWAPPSQPQSGAPVATAKSQADPAAMQYGDQMRNLGGALQTAGGAVLKAPLEAIKYAVSAPGYEGTPLADLPGIAKNIVTMSGASASPTASPIKQAAQESARPEFQPAKSVYGDARPATAPAAPGAAPRLNNADGVNVGNGVTRFDTPGKSPLFTNMTDAAGMASNQALQNRGAITPENQAIAQAMSDRYGREAQNTNQRAANATQMAGDTAAAQRSTDAGLVLADKVGRRMQREMDIQNGEATLSQKFANPQQRANADKQIASARASGLQEQSNEGAAIREAARERVTLRSQDIGDKHFNDQNAIARSKLALDQSAEGRAAKSFEQQQATLSRLTALQAAAGKAKPGPERDAIMAEILAMSNKEPANRFSSHATQNIKNADGSTTQGHVYSTNLQTGEIKMSPVPGAGAAATPKAEYDQMPAGSTYTGTDGKQYKKG